MVKTKLEQTLDDLDDTLEREKRQKNDIEKSRRKIEAELKVSQEMVGEIEREKKELESVVGRREREIQELMAKLENEQASASKQQRVIKELNCKLIYCLCNFIRLPLTMSFLQHVLRNGKKSLKQRGRPDPKLRGKGLTLQGSWKTWVRG